jgi:antitoxin (DNA-binding transcriptional repressor) of toxin-antitoxin stability system
MRYTIEEAEADLDRLIASALDGEAVIISRDDAPVVRLAPLGQPRGRATFGFIEPQPELTEAFRRQAANDNWPIGGSNGDGS